MLRAALSLCTCDTLHTCREQQLQAKSAHKLQEQAQQRALDAGMEAERQAALRTQEVLGPIAFCCPEKCKSCQSAATEGLALLESTASALVHVCMAALKSRL